MKHFFVGLLETLKEEGLIFILFLAACFTHNMDRGSYVYVGLMVIILFRLLFTPIKRYIDKTVLLLLSFGMLYVLFSPRFDLENAIRILFGPTLFYIYGRYIVVQSGYNQDHVKKMLIMMIISISFTVWWAVINNMLEGNIISTTSVEGARWLTTWGQSKMTSATTYGMIASFGLCGLGYFIMHRNKINRFDSWVLLICSICSILTTTYLINRSGLVILGITIVVALLYGMRKTNKKIVVTLTITFFILLYFLPLWGGVSIIADAYSERSSITAGGERTWRWMDAIERILSNPFGWTSKDSSYDFVHNMWLDVARVAGTLPFIVFVIATCSSIKSTLTLFKKKGDDLSLLLITLYLAVFSSYMIEPVIEANIFYVLIFTWIWGVEREVVYGIHNYMVTYKVKKEISPSLSYTK